jgi:hypothetical protein
MGQILHYVQNDWCWFLWAQIKNVSHRRLFLVPPPSILQSILYCSHEGDFVSSDGLKGPSMPKKTVSQKALVRVESLVRSIRGERVILDSDLAKIYGVSTKRLNEQVRRNIGRFPRDFMIQLTSKEHARLRSQNATSNIGRGGRRYIPLSFTEHGAIMAANVLNSKRALQMSVYVVRAFVQLRGTLRANKELGRWLEELERRVEKHVGEIHAIFETIRRLMVVPEKPRRQMGFEVNGEAARLRPSSRR